MSVITTGKLSELFGVTVTSTLIEKLGFAVAPRPEGAGKRGIFWHESDVPDIARKLGQHLIDNADDIAAKLEDEL